MSSSQFSIRNINLHDFDEIKKIHEKFYKEEFDFPDFLDKYLFVAVVEKDKQIICAGGVRTIAESIIVTDKGVDFNDKIQALAMMYDASVYFTKQYGYDELHAFIQDKDRGTWRKWLQKAGFNPTKGQCLLINI